MDNQNYMLQGDEACTCSRNGSMAENITTINLAPDALGNDITTSSGQTVTANSFFGSALFFRYSCNPTSVFSASSCFNSTFTYFDPRYLTVVVTPSSNILTYTLTLNNTQSQSIGSNCASSVKANSYLLGESLGGRIALKKRVNFQENSHICSAH